MGQEKTFVQPRQIILGSFPPISSSCLELIGKEITEGDLPDPFTESGGQQEMQEAYSDVSGRG